MGYRSDVAGLIYGDGSQEDNDKTVALWARANMQELVSKINSFDYQSIRLVVLDGDWQMQCIRLSEEGVKWYENSAWVKAWDEITQLAINEYDLNVEFVRIGEDYEDITNERSGNDIMDFLSVSRTINEDFVIVKEKETENG
jgi:hypothetical protein